MAKKTYQVTEEDLIGIIIQASHVGASVGSAGTPEPGDSMWTERLIPDLLEDGRIVEVSRVNQN